jgi:L-threonylcarbamoyladenylate synthase
MHALIGTDIELAADLLKKGKLVAIPTETVYGLAGNALLDKTIANIFEVKGRPHFNPLIMHCKSVSHCNAYAYFDDNLTRLAQKFMPGPLSLLVQKKEVVPDLLTAGHPEVVVRVPAHPLTMRLLEMLSFPLAAPSANPFGYISPTTAEHVATMLGDKISYILDGGACQVGLESTIATVENNSVIIFREGGLEPALLGDFLEMPVYKTTSKNHKTAGQIKSHYAPKTPLYMGDISKLLKLFPRKKIATITLLDFDDQQDNVVNYPLSPTGSISEAAQNLFRTLHLIDKGNFDMILAEIFPEIGLGTAINDRLYRAQWKNKK